LGFEVWDFSGAWCLGFGVSFSELVLAVPAVLLALRRASGDATHKAIFFYGTCLREQCEQDPAFGYELMKRTAEVVIKRLQAARKYLVELRTEGRT